MTWSIGNIVHVAPYSGLMLPMVARVSSGQRRHTGAVALDEGAHDAVVAQQLGDGEDHVGRGDAGPSLTGDPQADHRGQEHGQRLSQHGRLGLDPAYAPPEHAEPVDHHRVRVGAHERVAEGAPVVGREHEAREVLEVDLVADARAGRHQTEVPEGALGPTQELVSLEVARILDRDVGVVRRGSARPLGDHRVVDDQLDGDEGVDLGGVAAQAGERVAHRGQVDHGRDAGEVLHQDALGREGDLVRRCARTLPVPFGVGTPARHRHDVVGRDVRAVLVAQQVLEEDLDGVGEPIDVVPLGQHGRLDVEDLVGAVANCKIGAGAEGVGVRCRGGGVRAHLPILPWAWRDRPPRCSGAGPDPLGQ